MRAALEDEARFLVTREDVDRIAEDVLRFPQEVLRIRSNAHRLRADGAHAFRGKPCEALIEAGKRSERAGLNFRRKRSGLVKASGKPDGFLPVALRDDAFALYAADFNAEAVAAEIYCT